ncbi:hypothetical protein ACQ9ZF_10995 (plasmid) [Cetobacterium somerae]|uniref:hypothetical protein n=1 Tax=Cetobacterium somerae TaxID=188913 RepID=UPI003D766871
MRIELQILSVENGEVVIKEDYITKAQYQYDTPDTSLMKSNEINVRLIIEGKIERTISKETKKLAQWSLMKTGKDVYRIVKVIIKDENESDNVREFELSKAFAVDYEETYENKEAMFKLLVAQKGDEIEGVKVRD